MTKQTVAIALSGGVDSSVAAHLLQQQGYELFGLFMKNWEEEKDGVCAAEKDHHDAMQVCETLNIPLYTVNFTKEYRERVFTEFLAELKAGKTPNPDILCNSEIKFDRLLERALRLGADLLATGHYCRRGVDEEGKAALLKGVDPGKDQSYFLHAVPSEALERVLFPLGDLHKGQVRQLAKEKELSTAEKKDSTGICFIGKRNFKEFVSGYIAYQKGEIVDLEGRVVGEHDGTAYYTIGQRKGLAIGGAGQAWFVVDKQVENNRLVVVQGASHPALLCSGLEAAEVRWVAGKPPKTPLRCSAKVRYRQPDVACTLFCKEGGGVSVVFDEGQRAVTPGQSVVFYLNDRCLGGARIEQTSKRGLV